MAPVNVFLIASATVFGLLGLDFAIRNLLKTNQSQSRSLLIPFALLGLEDKPIKKGIEGQIKLLLWILRFVLLLALSWVVVVTFLVLSIAGFF